MRDVVHSRLIGTLLIAAVCGCDTADRSEAPPQVSVRDSAGVQILTHAQEPFVEAIPSVPIVTVGREGDPRYEFFRVNDVVALGSGNIVVANAGSSELRFYYPDGRYLRAVGASGDGPSEFGRITGLWVRNGDTLTVHDNRRRRLVHFDSTGAFVRGEVYGPELEIDRSGCTSYSYVPSLLGQLDDGARLLSGAECMNLEGTDGVRRTSLELALVRDGDRTPLGVFSGALLWDRAAPPSPREFFDIIPLGGVLKIAIAENEIFLTEGVEFEIASYNASGRLTRIIREDGPPPEVTAADRETYRAERIAREFPLSDDVPFPDRHASYSRLVSSHGGELWARRAPRPGDVEQRWVVFSPDGRSVRRVILPDITLSSVRDGRLYGVQTDELGLERVVVLDGS